MIDSYFRKPYQTLLVDPIVDRLVPLNLSPGVYTFGALVMGLAMIPALALEMVWIALGLLLLSGYLDTVDGSVARATDHTTPRGAVFDIVADRVVEFSILFGLFLVEPEVRGVPCLLMLGSVLICVTSFLVVGIFTANDGEKSFHYSPGIMERTEAFTFFAAMILFPGWFTLLSGVFTLLVLLTATIRIWQFSINPLQNTLLQTYHKIKSK